ncbi:hypothetical protein L596_014690 [Steinernema carpocapsae]|uniref:DUF7778 domain-containing protein n=1 Tax=Steinernema carpocapsae TaxID=34508 RepID=A0A4U5NDG3_STECR|nr:hypothetical protein L596_014690 [Steinernema carpocapsae]
MFLPRNFFFEDSSNLFKPQALPFCSEWRFDASTTIYEMVSVQRSLKFFEEDAEEKFCVLVGRFFIIYEDFESGSIIDLQRITSLKVKHKLPTALTKSYNQISIIHSTGVKVAMIFDGCANESLRRWVQPLKDAVYRTLKEDMSDGSFLDIATTNRETHLRLRESHDLSFYSDATPKKPLLKRVKRAVSKKFKNNIMDANLTLP